jgi:hypothetical protein
LVYCHKIGHHSELTFQWSILDYYPMGRVAF